MICTKKFGSPKLKTDKTVTGYVTNFVSPRSYFNNKLRIDDEKFEVNIYVVWENTTKVKRIFRDDFINQADVQVNKGIN